MADRVANQATNQVAFGMSGELGGESTDTLDPDHAVSCRFDHLPAAAGVIL